MKKSFLVLAWLLAVGAVHGGAETPSTNRLASLSLTDQFGQTHHLRFPTNRPVILMAADRKGYPDTAGWVMPVKNRYSTNVIFLGVADVHGVPGPLKGMVRRRIKAGAAHSLMLDWEGELARALPCHPGVVNVFVLDSDGRMQQHVTGPAASNTLSGVFQTVDKALPPK